MTLRISVTTRIPKDLALNRAASGQPAPSWRRFLVMTVAITGILVASRPSASAIDPPGVLADDWTIELVASDPELVTPISCRFDTQGRLLVVESHTHFPPADYAGPKSDRIYLFDDTDGDGRLDRQRLFYEGGRATMGLEVIDDGWIVVASRDRIVRIRDTSGDDVADEEQVLVRLETSATYPHNGLGGLAIHPDGDLYFGQGENLGEPYVLIARDGSRQVGGGEGGNVFRCRPDGTGLSRVATGFWNPFGLHFDPAGRLWAVCNDPDARPPCRLLHVVEGADFGFQFRLGRAGTHPLQGWNGEQPGTLPMASGTGEAPCAVVSHGDGLWVTSWGDNRIERYRLSPSGASWSGLMEVVVQGNATFRPVDMAVAKDGSIYVTDWVDRSYPVHGRGRLWRLVPKSRAAFEARWPKLSEAERFAERLRSDESLPAAERVERLSDDDRFIRQAAMMGLVRMNQLDSITADAAPSPEARIGLMLAYRWGDLVSPEAADEQRRERLITESLADRSPEVVRAAIRWAVETGDDSFLPAISAVLGRDELPDNLFASAVGGIAFLETGGAAGGRRDPAQEKLLVEFASDAGRSSRLRALAVRMLPADADVPTTDVLGGWLNDTQDPVLVGELVRLLVARGSDAATELLGKIAGDESIDAESRADAIAGLSRQAASHAATLNRLALPKQNATIRREARRVLRREQDPQAVAKPASDDLDAWENLLAGGGDARAGWRVFVRTTCANCHAHSGRGAGVGPDLTGLAGQTNRRKIIESIVQPSKEAGPLYVAWQILTDDGRALSGLKLNDGSESHARFIGADGERFEVALDEIRSQRPSKLSIMPAKLEETMSIEEFRDLVAFLAGPTE